MPWNPSPNTQAQSASNLLTPSAGISNQSVAGGATSSLGPYNIAQIGYDILFSAVTGGTGTNGFMEVQLQWIDSVSGDTLATDSWICPVSGNSSPFPIYGHGPTKADTVTINVTNLDTISNKFSVTLFQNSRVYVTDDWRWNNSQITGGAQAPAGGYTLTSYPNDESVLGMANITVPVSSSISRLFGMFNGLCYVYYTATGAAAINQVLTIEQSPASTYNTTKILSVIVGDLPGSGSATIPIPFIGVRGPLNVTVQDLSSATTVSANICIACQPQ
jgi:hypothetical protein